MQQIQNLPVHVLVVPDGNRRWARNRGTSDSNGHSEGAKRFRENSKLAFKMGIKYFTFWAASAGNLVKRNPMEIKVLASLFRHEIEDRHIRENFLKNQVRFRVIGKWYEILGDNNLLNSIRFLEDCTREFNQHFLTILFGYSGEDEWMDSVERIFRNPPGQIDRETLRGALRKTVWTHDLPPVDLMIRTGGEKRDWTHNSAGILNPWLTPDSQIFSPRILWPDFLPDIFRQTIDDYSKTTRRFGA